MTEPSGSRLTGAIVVGLSLTALLTVIAGSLQAPPPVPRADEGALAHIFQLSIGALVPAVVLFLATADWTHPARRVRPLVFSAVIVALASGGLYYLEHIR